MDKKKLQNLALWALALIATKGEAGFPSGHLYSEMMNRCSLNEYEMALSVLKDAKWVTESGFLLKATPDGKTLGLKVADIIAG